MTDHNDTGATARLWSYDIQHGPNGEEIYAWLYYHNLMVCTVKVHHARLIVKAVNAYEPLKARLAEVERERNELRNQIEAEAEYSYGLRTGKEAVEARVAVLEMALEFYANPEIYKPHPHGAAFDRRDKSYIARAALAEQKED